MLRHHRLHLWTRDLRHPAQGSVTRQYIGLHWGNLAEGGNPNPFVGPTLSALRFAIQGRLRATRRLYDQKTFKPSRNRPLRTSVVVREYLASGISFPAKRTFELTPASRFLADGEYSIPAKHAFRYNPTFASLSFLGMPARVEVPRFPVMSEPPPLFRTNSTKAW